MNKLYERCIHHAGIATVCSLDVECPFMSPDAAAVFSSVHGPRCNYSVCHCDSAGLQENAAMRATIAAQTINKDDVVRMNQER